MSILLDIKLPARLESLEKLVGSVSKCAREDGFSNKKVGEIELAAEEALVNVFKYAYQDAEGDVEVVCRSDDENFIVEVIDSGVPFDILSLKDPDITSEISRREIGGLGVYFIKKIMDDVRHRRYKDKNILSLILHKSRVK